MKSRRNGLKHGLTGAGIVLPTEDAQVLAAVWEHIRAAERAVLDQTSIADLKEADVDPIVPDEGPAEALRVDRGASNDRLRSFVQIKTPLADPPDGFPGQR
jgi:hypothetical protein